MTQMEIKVPDIGDFAEVTVIEPDKRIAGDVKPSFKWRHASWVEELGIACLTSSTVVKVDDSGVR